MAKTSKTWVQFTAYIPPETLEALKESAKREHRSINAQLVWYIEQGLAKEKTLNGWTAEKTAWANHHLDYVTDIMSERDDTITPETLSETFQKEEGLSLTPQEAAAWLATQDWYSGENKQ